MRRPGLAPSGRGRQYPGLELAPRLCCLVAIDGLHPQEEAEAWGRGARIFKDDLLRWIAVHQFIKAFGRISYRPCVVDDGEMRIVIGEELIVRPFDRQGELALILAVRTE